MTKENLLLLDLPELILSTKIPFIGFYQERLKNDYAGRKFTVVGTGTPQCIDLIDRLGQFLVNIQQPFKVATESHIKRANSEQRVKLFTIYICKNTKVKELQDDIEYLLRGYKTTAKLQKSEYVSNALYKRTDIINGQYVPA